MRIRRKSTILLTVIVILLFLGIMGMSLLGFLFLRTEAGILASDRLKAFYLAEAGISKSINELRSDKDYDKNGIGNVASTKLGDGVFWVEHNFQTSTITAVGEVNKVKRTIQIKYAVL